MSRHDGSRRRPIGSFLFLGPCHSRSKALVGELVWHMFDSRDAVIRFDMSEYRDLHSVGCDSCILGIRSSGYNLEGHGVGGKLIEAVNNRPFCVLLFDNVDKVNNYAIDILLDILRHGSLIDRQGNEVDFTKSLVIMTSDVGKGLFQHWLCNCLEKVPSCTTCTMYGFYVHAIWKGERACGCLPVLGEAKKRFKGELLELLDDVIVFNSLSLPHLNAIARIKIRERAYHIGKYDLIVYPSHATLRSIIFKSSCLTLGVEGLKIWLEKNVDPVLSEMVSENKINANSTIYIDSLTGTDELSYRKENRRFPLGDDISSRFKESLKELRRVYLKEKEYVNNFYTLWKAYLELITTLDSQNRADPNDITLAVRHLGDKVDGLINTAKNNLVCNDDKLAPVNFLNEEAESSYREQGGERASGRLEGLRTILYGNLEGKYQAIDVVAEAVWSSIDAPHSLPHHPVKSFLFLGLTCVGKADLVKGLAELFGTDDEAQMVTEINMQEYSDPDSFFQLMGGSLDLPLHHSHEQHGLGLLEAIKMKPYRVLLVDQIEKAQMSVFGRKKI
ncbi:chaperone protein ClpB1-like isoform X2 [Cornus florida]|uniref:chaperone protein ClpB1-like isoform X2 n=1 Tax=Cornus florida TaxID=4283 RepID=UPI002896FEEA|nr:chaperone protein ClpB1-like isoform X2 [Cornus florida]